MSLTINSNMPAIQAQPNLSVSMSQLSKSMTRLSSGLRINSAIDNNATANYQQTQVRKLNEDQLKTNDGISVVQTAVGGLDNISSNLVRMRELAVQSAAGNLSDSDRARNQEEFAKLSGEIDKTANSTQFNGKNLLDGSFSMAVNEYKDTTRSQSQNSSNNKINIAVGKMDSSSLKIDASNIDISTKDGANAALESLNEAISSVNGQRNSLGATQNRLESTLTNIQVATENINASSRIRDIEIAGETASLTRNNILSQAGTAILAQANQAPQQMLSLLR